MMERLGDRGLSCDIKIGRPITEVVGTPEFSRVDTIVHCAAVQLFTPGYDLRRYETFQRMNVDAADQLLAAAAKAGVRKVIHISTDMVYGVPPERPLSPDDPLNPVGFYGRSKVAAEAVVRDYASHFEVVTILRPRVIGGPGRGGLFETITRLLQRRLPIPVFGNGRNRFQMIHVEDFADLILEAVDRDVAGTYNAGSTEVTTLRAKLDAIATLLHRTPFVLPIPESFAVALCGLLYTLGVGPLHPEQYCIAGRTFVLDIERTLAAFRWRPKYGDNDVVLDAARALTGVD